MNNADRRPQLNKNVHFGLEGCVHAFPAMVGLTEINTFLIETLVAFLSI